MQHRMRRKGEDPEFPPPADSGVETAPQTEDAADGVEPADAVLPKPQDRDATEPPRKSRTASSPGSEYWLP